MHSKASPMRKIVDLDSVYLQDFIQDHHRVVLYLGNQDFIYLLSPYVDGFKQQFDQSIRSSDVDQLRDEINSSQNLSLFQETKFLFFHLWGKVKIEDRKVIEQAFSSDAFDKIVVVVSDKDFFKQLSQHDDVHCLGLEDVKFWEFRKLIYFLNNYFSLTMGKELIDFIENSYEANFATYYNILRNIHFLQQSNPNLTDQQIINHLDGQMIDKFQLAQKISQKKYHKFFKDLWQLFELQQFQFIDTLYFLESHLLKLADTSYLAEKKYHSKYDKEIVEYSQSFSTLELSRLLEKVRELQIDCRKKDPLLGLKLISSVQKTG